MARGDPQADGFVLIYRGLLDHPVFHDEPEAWAFASLILQAAWKPTRVRYKERTVVLERGQVAVSVRDFGERWCRSKSWAQPFFDKLELAGMIEKKRDRGRDKSGTASGTAVNVLTICNYDKYQTFQQRDGTVTDQQVGQGRDTEQRRERRKEKKEEKPPTPFEPPAWMPREAWLGWIEVRKKNRWPLTDRALSLAVKEIEKLRDKGHDPTKLLDLSTLNGWRAIYPGKGKETLTQKAKLLDFGI